MANSKEAVKRSWIAPTVILCLCGLLNYLKPSEPFLTPYLMGPKQNLTEEDLVNTVFPVWIYSYLSFLLPAFLLTDYVRYKPVIIVQGLGYVSCWLLLCFGNGVPMMQLMQVFYGLATATEIGYYSYIYSIVKYEHYQRVTSYVRASTQLGLLIGSILAQLLVSVVDLDYFYLHLISLINVSIAFVMSLFLPMPKTSLFFFTGEDVEGSKQACETPSDNEEVGETNKLAKAESDSTDVLRSKSKWKRVLISLVNDAKACYTDAVLLRWSVWWALSTCGWILVVNYVQNLWETILPSTQEKVYNGAVETVATVLGVLGAFSVGFIKLDWTRWGEIALGVCSLFKFGLLMLMYLTTNIWMCYAAYVGFIALYNFVITVTQFQLAIGLTTRSFALVFGVNTFAAVALNTVLTVILIDRAVLGLDVSTMFVIYSVYFGIVALVFFGHGLYVASHYAASSHANAEKVQVEVGSGEADVAGNSAL